MVINVENPPHVPPRVLIGPAGEPQRPACFTTWLRGLANEDKAEAERFWIQGWILNEEYKDGRFMQDYSGQEKSERLFFKHAEEHSRRKRSTLQRWMALSLVYTLARVLELVSLGACPSVLMAIAQADPEDREMLERLALDPELSYDHVVEAISEGRKLRKKKLWLDNPEARFIEMQKAALRRKERDLRARLEDKEDRRKNGARDEDMDGQVKALRRELELLEGRLRRVEAERDQALARVKELEALLAQGPGPGGAGEPGAEEVAQPGPAPADEPPPPADEPPPPADEPQSQSQSQSQPADEPPPPADEPPPPPPADEAAPPPPPPPPPGPALVPVRKPNRTRPGQQLILVPYPADDPDPTPQDRVLTSLIVAFDLAHRTAAEAHERWFRGRDHSTPLLSHRVNVALTVLFWEMRDDFFPFLEQGREQGRLLFEQWQRDAPDLSLSFMMPVPLEGCEPPRERVAMRYLSIDVSEPSHTNPSPVDFDLLRLLALVSLIEDLLCDLIPFAMQGYPLMRDLSYQCYEAAFEANRQFTMLRTLIAEMARQGEKEAEVLDAENERLRQARRRLESEMIVLGENEVGRRHVKIGLTLDGRLLALTLYRPLFWAIVGTQGFGKTHLGVLISEGAFLDLVGINELDGRRSRVWTFCAEWRRESGNHQLLCGLYSNIDRDELSYLKEHFDYTGNAAFERLVLVVLPGRKKVYEDRYPELLERGLEVVEGRLHAEETGLLFYTLMLNSGAEGPGKERPQYIKYMEGVIADADPAKLTPGKLRKIMEDKRLGGPTLYKQLDGLDAFVSTGEHFAGHLDDEAPHLVHAESRTLGRDLLLPMQVSYMNALRMAPQQNLHRIFILEEMGKGSENEAVLNWLENAAEEVRHGTDTVIASGQKVQHFPARIWSVVTGGAMFYLASPEQFHQLQRQVGALAGERYEDYRDMVVGEGAFWSSQVSDSRLRGKVIRARLRPSCILAGGKTKKT